MKSKQTFIDIVSVLLVVLFFYTASSKLADFETFSIQLRKSPMFVESATIVAWATPAIELVVGALLLFNKTRRFGLVASLALMALFTSYIIAILNFSEYVPCTCGGVIQKLSWSQHLIFNSFFLAITLIALFFEFGFNQKSLRLSTAVITAGAVIVFILFRISYDDRSKYKSFDRVASTISPSLSWSRDLTFFTYYFGGVAEDSVYLVNDEAPLNILAVDNTSGSLSMHRIKIIGDHNFHKPTIRIQGPTFFMLDGVSPRVLKGRTSDWIAYPTQIDSVYFNQSLPINSTTLAVRVHTVDPDQYNLGTLDAKHGLQVHPDLLKRQLDGKFCLDGSLLFNPDMNRIIYVHAYRNEYIVTDTTLGIDYRGRTIDSVTVAKISFVSNKKNNHHSLNGAPLVVNRRSATDSTFLFVQSGLQARNESYELFNTKSHIDVYSLSNRKYLESFYLPMPAKEIREMRMHRRDIFVLSGHQILKYNMTELVKELHGKEILLAGKVPHPKQ